MHHGCINALESHILPYDASVEDYLDNLVPCSIPYSEDVVSIHTLPFWEYIPAAGKTIPNYHGLTSGLVNVVASFPEHVRPSFVDTHNTDFPLPFEAFAHNHHCSSPDISVSFPGERVSKAILKRYRWQKIAMAIVTKAVASDDPFFKSGECYKETIMQIARNARALMLLHGFLFAFVLGIYGDIVRIIRFDRSCALVSRPFNLRTHPRLLQRFFWHFTHPRVGKTVVGCDPTVCALTPAEDKWIRIQLAQAKKPFERLPAEVALSRRVEVHNESDGAIYPFFLYKLIDVNARLLSRSTMVWRALPDHFLKDPEATQPVKTHVLKESWRQIVRPSEASFYARLQSAIPEEERFGFPTFLCGGDMGQMEIREWEVTPAAAEILEDQRDSRLHADDKAVDSDDTEGEYADPLTIRLRPNDPADSASEDEGLSSTKDSSEVPSEPSFPLPYPQHQTFSWAHADPDFLHLERSHMRFVVEQVGRHLTEFKDTKELCRAIMDAIKGHRLAWEKAGVLQRDISLSNVLISDDPEEDGAYGFIHDFDYSYMSKVVPGQNGESTAAECSEDECKQRTGTHYFIAYEIMAWPLNGIAHRYDHDLESFYWVLVWVVIRYTQHNLGQSTSESIFGNGSNDAETCAKKQWWLLLQPGQPNCPLVIANNAPLTELMEKLRKLIRRNALLRDVDDPPNLTYDAMLSLFEQALEREEWPESDRVPCHLLDPSNGSKSLYPEAPTVAADPLAKVSALSRDPNRISVSDSVGAKKSQKRASDSLFVVAPGDPFVAQGEDDADAGPSNAQRDSGSSKRRKTNLSRSAAPVLTMMGPPATPSRPSTRSRNRGAKPSSRRGGRGSGAPGTSTGR